MHKQNGTAAHLGGGVYLRQMLFCVAIVESIYFTCVVFGVTT